MSVRPTILATLLLLLGVTATLAGALWDADGGGSLFTNRKAHRVGDILTVFISESSSASSDAQTDTENKTELGGEAGSGFLDFIPLWGVTSENKYKGKGKTSRKGQLSAVMSVRITQILPGDQFRVEGTRSVTRNGEEDLLSLSGLVRSRDIGPDNTLPSSAIADAIIVYQGEGEVANGQNPGILTRLVNWIL